MDDHAGPDRWRRFTILDASILVASAALGLRLAGDESGRWWLAPGTATAVTLFAGLAIGSVIAVPAILASQWAFRTRRMPPRCGEILGLASATLWAVTIAGTFVLISIDLGSSLGLLLLVGAIWIQGLLALVSAAYLLGDLTARRQRPRLPWTDRLGPVANILVGLWSVADVASGLGQL